MAAITGVVAFQVLTRYVLQHPAAWPEEAARYLFVWVALLGAALGVDRGVHFSLDLLTSRLPEPGRAPAGGRHRPRVRRLRGAPRLARRVARVAGP